MKSQVHSIGTWKLISSNGIVFATCLSDFLCTPCVLFKHALCHETGATYFCFGYIYLKLHFRTMFVCEPAQHPLKQHTMPWRFMLTMTVKKQMSQQMHPLGHMFPSLSKKLWISYLVRTTIAHTHFPSPFISNNNSNFDVAKFDRYFFKTTPNQPSYPNVIAFRSNHVPFRATATPPSEETMVGELQPDKNICSCSTHCSWQGKKGRKMLLKPSGILKRAIGCFLTMLSYLSWRPLLRLGRMSGKSLHKIKNFQASRPDTKWHCAVKSQWKRAHLERYRLPNFTVSPQLPKNHWRDFFDFC